MSICHVSSVCDICECRTQFTVSEIEWGDSGNIAGVNFKVWLRVVYKFNFSEGWRYVNMQLEKFLKPYVIIYFFSLRGMFPFLL